MRVALVTEYYYPHLGGVTEHVANLSRQFQQAGHTTLIVTGTFATAAGPHSGGVKVRRLGTLDSAVWLHVRATAVFAISFALLLAWLFVRRSRHLRWALAVFGLLVVQMVIGEIQYRTYGTVSWYVVLVHVALAASLFAWTVGLVARLWRPLAHPGRT